MRASDAYEYGEKAELFVMGRLRAWGFYCFRYDESTLKAPGFRGEDVLGVRYIQAPDIGVAAAFDVQVKRKASPTWSWKAGQMWRHGFPEKQYESYLDFQKLTGRRLAIWIVETGPLRINTVQSEHRMRARGEIVGNYPISLIQWLDRLGIPLRLPIEGDPHVLWPRRAFEPEHQFMQRIKDQNPPPGPSTRRLPGF